MERELWPILYHYLQLTAKEVRQKYVQIPPWVIVATMLWAAVHDRPVCWACNPDHWDTTRLRPHNIPSEATIRRQQQRPGCSLGPRRWRFGQRL